MPPITVLLLSAHALWVHLCTRALESLPRRLDVVPVVLDQKLDVDLFRGLPMAPDVILVSLDFPAWVSEIGPALRAAGLPAPVLLLCSCYALPELEDLEASGVSSVVSSLATPEELAAALYALADGHPDPLPQQYVRAARTATRYGAGNTLSDREREILQLVAADLTDEAIAQRLHVSTHTIHNHLRHAYAKLGVRGRAGAVATAVARGILRSPTDDS